MADMRITEVFPPGPFASVTWEGGATAGSPKPALSLWIVARTRAVSGWRCGAVSVERTLQCQQVHVSEPGGPRTFPPRVLLARRRHILHSD